MANPNIAALSRFQMERFFRENPSVTQEQCDAKAQELTGQSATATASQGGSSYTVEGGEVVVQFRVPTSPLNMDFIQIIEQTYRGFTPRHTYRGRLGDVFVYTMNNVGGTCMYLARTELHSNDYHLLRFTIDDYARFFASAYDCPLPVEIQPDRTQLFDKCLSQLRQLRDGLPERFHSTLDYIIPKLPALFSEDWPLVPNHTDLLENNIHVDPATGKIVGICDWREAEVGPFGMSLGGLETMLGIPVMNADRWRYHDKHQELRDLFWARFYGYIGGASDEQKQCIEVARLAGLFLANGFQDGKPATEESDDLRFLGAVVLAA